MKHSIKILLLIVFIHTIPHIYADDSYAHTAVGRSFFNQRPQGQYTGREMAGWVDNINCYNMGNSYFSSAITADFFKSYDSSALGSFLFFTGYNTMQFGDANNPGVNVFEQNFLLNNGFQGYVTCHPHVSNIIVDFDMFVGLDSWMQNLYFKAHTTLCRTRWNIALEQEIFSTGTAILPFALGNTTFAAAPTDNIIAAWNGDNSFFDVTQPLQYARINGSHALTRIADVEVALGYNFISHEYSHFGINARAIIPTGNTPNAIYLFEPIVGNGHHFELGMGLSGHSELWNYGAHTSLGVYFEGNFYHMFKNKQKRTFDLIQNGIGSRYLLFKVFDGATNTYSGEIVRGPNILTLDCHVRNSFHADASFMVHYKHRGLTFDGGYNVWARSGDIISDIASIPANTYGITGTSGTDPLANRNRTASLTTISGENAGLLDGTSSADNVYLSNEDINRHSAEHPNTFVHAFFIHSNYIWEQTNYSPFLGGGAQIEFAGQHGRALKMWHIWLKGGCSL